MRADCFAFTKTVEASDYGKKTAFRKEGANCRFFVFLLKKPPNTLLDGLYILLYKRLTQMSTIKEAM